MERACYRCGQTIDDSLAFCSSCGAPQIKVSRPEPPAPEASPASPDSPLAPAITSDVASPGVQWRHFLRLALPLALLTGIVTTVLFFPGLLVVLPATSIWAISRYQQRHHRLLRGGQSVRMGAVSALLSFGFFLAINAPGLEKTRPSLVTQIQEKAAQTPDPQAREMILWLATPDAWPVVIAVTLALLLVLFLLVGLASGALAARLGRNPPRV